MGSIKVLVVEDDALFRLGLTLALTDIAEFDIVGEAADGRDAVEQALNNKPDLILMDVALPVLNGMEACTRIKSSLPKSAILMLSSRIDKETIAQSFDAGADGYCYKEIDHGRLAQIMKELALNRPPARVWT